MCVSNGYVLVCAGMYKLIKLLPKLYLYVCMGLDQ